MKKVYFTFALLFLFLGFLGALLPLLPTTPFLLLSAYYFSKSSSRFYSFLIEHKKFGRTIFYWFEYSVIPRKIKITASLTMLITSILSALMLQIPWWGEISALIIFLWGGVYIWKKPETHPKRHLIIGYGDTGLHLAERLQRKNKDSLIFATKRKWKKKNQKNISPIIFVIEESKTWKNIPYVDETFFLAPWKRSPLSYQFLSDESHKLGRVVLVSSTSCYKENSGELVNEMSVKVQSSLEQKVEKFLLQKKGILAVVAGIYGKEKSLWLWPKSGRITQNKYLNLIYIQDLAEILIILMQSLKKSESYNVSDGVFYEWKKMIHFLEEENILTEKFHGREGILNSSSKCGKRVSNLKLKKILPPDFKFRILRDVILEESLGKISLSNQEEH